MQAVMLFLFSTLYGANPWVLIVVAASILARKPASAGATSSGGGVSVMRFVGKIIRVSIRFQIVCWCFRDESLRLVYCFRIVSYKIFDKIFLVLFV